VDVQPEHLGRCPGCPRQLARGEFVEEFYDYVLAPAPEFVRGRQAADDAITRGELGVPLADVLAELDAEDRGDRRSA
jgi:hypothetical protein